MLVSAKKNMNKTGSSSVNFIYHLRQGKVMRCKWTVRIRNTEKYLRVFIVILSPLNRSCLSRKKWITKPMECDCVPSCNSIGYSLVHHMFKESYDNSTRINIYTDAPKSRIKQDVLFSIDFLIGKSHNILIFIYLFFLLYTCVRDASLTINLLFII